MGKPRVAIFDFACCEGCQLQIANMDEDLLKLIELVEPVEWREAMSEKSDRYDIAIVEGSITRPEDERRVRDIRRRAETLIALGSCATHGGLNKLRNRFPMEEVRRTVYGESASMPHLDSGRVKAVQEVVSVDLKIYGCPIEIAELSRMIRELVAGRRPLVPNYPVCVECKLRENVCRYEYDEICLGPVTRAGCNARCPSNGMWCFGCRGPVDRPNVNAARDVMERYRKTVEDLVGKLELFWTGEERING
ncbi:MAG TPA: cytochrome B [Kiritimatiellae bacterium]|nr:cytochrome B [Kiritimatiellia bacterium]